ncbi:MAG: hypothetical protein JW730_02510 [Anaerolineales bacterium]|nr:hypothetical protein [Anaerolineales bacterium]
MKKSTLSVLMSVFLIVVASACFLASTPVPPTLVPSALPPTSTPEPTPTHEPTSTATSIPPTPTVAPPPILTDIFDNVRIVSIDPFDQPTNANWDLSKGGEINNGVLEVDEASIIHSSNYNEGNGIVVNFKYTKDSKLTASFLQTDPPRQFIVSLSRHVVAIALFEGSKCLECKNSPLRGNLSPQPDTWYSLLMAIGKNGDLIGVIWDPVDPSKVIMARRQIENWSGSTWKFFLYAHDGTVSFDDFTEIEFESIK